MTPPAPTPPRLRWVGLPPRIALGFAAALLSLGVAAAASYVALSARTAADHLVKHTATAQLAVEELESALLVSNLAIEVDLATGARASGQRFATASSHVRPALAKLERISDEHAEEKPRIARLAADLDVIRREHAEVVALLDRGDAGAARARWTEGGGRELVEAAMVTLDRLERDEARAHADREATWQRTVLASNVVFAVAVGALLVLILRAARLVREDLRRREADREARERALAVQQRLMAVVSHDLRNPLSGILATAWALGRMSLPPDASRMARRIVGAGRRMERLIRDLLDWSRVQGGAPLRLRARAADLHDVCQRIADELGDRDGARIRIEREGDTRAVLDSDRMEQIVCNLVSNALRHAPPEAPVRVRAVGDGDEVRLEVQDEGAGIPPEAQARIFEAFRQGPGGDGAGLGLGLFIVRVLVDAHGGTVELDSAPGRTRFVVRLRRGAVEATAGAARAG